MNTLVNHFLQYSNHLMALILAGVLAYIVGIVYVRCGNAVSNRKVFARNFLLVTMSTTLIIFIVKESIALSLGLVGALSIVRFRAAIKEPEEIAYLFLIIAIGIGLGAFQFAITLVAVPVIIGIIVLRSHYGNKTRAVGTDKFNVNVISKKTKEVGIGPVTDILKQQTEKVSLKHMSEDAESVSLLFHADFADIKSLDNLRQSLVNFEDRIDVDIVQSRDFT